MEAIKKFISENKRLVYTFGGFLAFFLLALIVILIIRGCAGNKMTFAKLENSMVEEAERYFKNNNILPMEEGSEVSVTLNELVQNEYIKSFDKLEDGTCSGSVTMKKNGNNYMYYPNLDCKEEYHTQVLSNILTNNVVTSGNGLYKVDDMYVFKGEYVDNYVSFAGFTWRIISLDKDKNIRMIQVPEDNEDDIWDDRYNKSQDDTVGINNYELSRVREYLNSFYNDSKNFGDESKKHLIAYDVCTGKRKETDTSISLKTDCSSTLKNEFIGLPYYSEYYMASLDKECKKTSDGSCSNYNYLDNLIYRAWTTNANKNNTYEVFVSGLKLEQCYQNRNIFPVIKISSRELVCSGNGTENEPYTIKISNTCEK